MKTSGLEDRPGALARALRRIAFALVALPSLALAQDTFEIQVYEYLTVPRGRWNLETHLNHTVKGSLVGAGSVAATDKQTHVTFELTRGITDIFEMAGYLVLADRQGHSPEYAGWRLRPRIRAPESWSLPVLLSLSLEVGFPTATYEEARTTLEIRPVIEKAFGKLLVDFNPVVGKALRGHGSGEDFDFEPGLRVGYAASPKLDLSIEYYASTGSVTDPLPGKEQVHLIFPGFDWNVNDDTVINFGYGVGLTDASDKGMLKMRIGRMFGGSKAK